ncbi:flagellin [Bacillus sp. SB49]|uniref:flagellin N-terminal helical domain-containing protein n=1 Tax=Bacillus sp. SB49 TaxID=1071080 RepID=UPI000410B988|nr:flagellin [Bacillus sp. SB49]QHT47988.1 flagellin [Bacillus sp. SB49]
MRINHNIAALNTYRQLGSANNAQSKSMEKLSSGLRINNAADDAAGLAISEKMRGQIRGLDMASKNAQDATSLIQTAEGGLNETHSILQRMRELAVQASNDTNTDVDRNEIQKEVDQLRQEVTRIGNNTEFNTKTLLNGGAGVQASQTDATVAKGIQGTSDTQATGVVAFTGAGVTSLATAATATIDLDATSDTVLTGGKVTINGTTLDVATGTSGEDLATTINESSDDFGVTANYDSSTHELTLTQKGSTGSASKIDVRFDGVFDSDTAASASVNTNISAQGSNATLATGADFTIDGTNAAAGDFVVEGNKVTITKDGNSKGLSFELTKATTANTITIDSNNSLKFAIGANTNQQMDLSINDMRAEALGISDIDVSNRDSANDAITTIQSAIETVSAERSKLGASQNRLEHTINNLDTSSENLTAAESRIRDVDMAKEMMEQTKNSILSQAAQAMLAQANQQPQGVLQLLR